MTVAIPTETWKSDNLSNRARGKSSCAISANGSQAKLTLLEKRVQAEPHLLGWRIGRTERVVSGFYMSQAVELNAP
ncbi:MAG: hypothetical protein AAGL49_12220 [Pseudomonadota bacterium]